ncbi:MAG: hypothetical protein MJZ17_05780 [Bacteroidales bacterium]|nr:hypothetical protein [Bacteroidales bacterium]
MNYILGADPGKHGAVFLLPCDKDAWKDGCLYFNFKKNGNGDMDAVSLYDFLKAVPGDIVAVYKEHVHAVAGNSATSMFSFGESNGILKAVFSLCGLDPIEVAPVTWQKTAWDPSDKVDGVAAVDKKTKMLKRDKNGNIVYKYDPKGTSKNAAHRLFAGTNVNFVPKGCRAEHDGVIDAALIAYHGFVKSNP